MPSPFRSRTRASTSPTSSGSRAEVTSSSSSSRGVVDQGPDDRDPLLLAAGEPVRVRAAPSRPGRPAPAGPGPWPRPRPRGTLCTRRGARVTLSSTRHVREQVVRLEHDADAAADLVGVDARVGDVLAVEVDRAVVDRLEQVDAAQQRRLAGAGRADERDDLVLVDVEGRPARRTGVAEQLAHAVAATARGHSRLSVRVTARRARPQRDPVGDRDRAGSPAARTGPGDDVRRVVVGLGGLDLRGPDRVDRPGSEISPTSFCSATKSLSSGGATRRTACGSTTCRIVWP